jgi:hypothetical protein
VYPELDAQQRMLKALRDRQKEDMESDRWRTEFSPDELRRFANLPPMRATQLLARLIDEGYVRGELRYDPERYFRRAISSGASEASYPNPIASVTNLTDKGLRAIGDLPDTVETPPPPPTPTPTPYPTPTSAPYPTPTPTPQPTPTPAPSPASRGETEETRKGASEGITTLFQTLFAFITLMIALSLPVGVITLWLQLASDHYYGFWTSLYAAAVTAKTIVVGKVIPVSLYSLSVLLPVLAWYARKRAYRAAGEQPTGWGPWRVLATVVLSIAFVTPIIALAVVWRLERISFEITNDVRDIILVIMALTSLVVVVIGASLLKRSVDSSRSVENGDRFSSSFWGGIAIAYVSSIIWGICVAGLQDLSLPVVNLPIKGQPQNVWLLSNSGSYWYVIDCHKNFKVIPNKQVPGSGAVGSEGVDMEGLIVGDSTHLLCSTAQVVMPRAPPIIGILPPPCKPTDIPKPPCKPPEKPKPPCKPSGTQCRQPPDDTKPQLPSHHGNPRLAQRPANLKLSKGSVDYSKGESFKAGVIGPRRHTKSLPEQPQRCVRPKALCSVIDSPSHRACTTLTGDWCASVHMPEVARVNIITTRFSVRRHELPVVSHKVLSQTSEGNIVLRNTTGNSSEPVLKDGSRGAAFSQQNPPIHD